MAKQTGTSQSQKENGRDLWQEGMNLKITQLIFSP